MKLVDFLKKERLRAIDFAKVIGCHQSHVSLIVHGRRRPSPELALRIEQATGGLVRKEDLLWPSQSQSSQDGAYRCGNASHKN